MIPNYFYRLFKSVQRLEEYLNISIQNLNISNQEKQQLKHLANEILIVKIRDQACYSEETVWKKEKDIIQESASMSTTPNKEDLDIRKVLYKLGFYLLSNSNLKNALMSGCSKTGSFNRIGVFAKYENAVINQIIDNESWSILLTCIGEDQFCRLFLDTVILCRLENGSYYQLSGNRLSGKLSLYGDNNSEKMTTEHVRSKAATIQSNVSDTLIGFSNQFNAIIATKPTKDTGRPKLSRRQKRKLNEAKSKKIEDKELARKKRRKWNDDDGGSIERAVMFYGETIINRNTNKPLMALPKKHVFHKDQVEKGDFFRYCMSVMFPLEFVNYKKETKFCSRFKAIPDLIKKIYKRHSRTNSLKLLNNRCPKQKQNQSLDVQSASCSYSKVTEFINDQLKKSFPLEFWGCQENLETILRAVQHFISRRKNEKITIHDIMHKFKIKECKWLIPPSNTTRFVPTDLERRSKVLRECLQWLFNGYIIPILKSMFYITEHAGYPKMVFYFRRDVWYELSQPRLHSILSESYRPCDPSQVINLALGVGRVRLLPKGNGFRVITNLKETFKYARNTNGEIRSAKFPHNEELLPVLGAMKSKQYSEPRLMGSSVLARHLFYERFKEYKKTKVKPGEKLYFVKADIANCFDNIDQGSLLDALKDILSSDDEYIFRNIGISRRLGNSIVTKSLPSAGTKANMDSIADFANRIKGLKPGSILIDQNNYHTKTTKDLLLLVEENITRNTVIAGGNFYTRDKGIAQGSSLSTLLCSFFFGQLEKEGGKLSFVKNDKDGVLFTYVDDFLYITKNIAYAKWFSNAIVHETKKIGIKVNPDKCVSNIQQEITEFSWLGYKINTQNLDVYLDLSSNYKDDIKTSMTVNFSNNPGKSLYTNAVKNIKSQFHKILMDADLNSKYALLRNLRENFFLAAVKMVCQASEISKSIKGFKNEEYLFEIIMRLGQVIIPQAPTGLKDNDVLYVFFKAFHNAFKANQTQFPNVTYCLRQVLDKFESAKSQIKKQKKGNRKRKMSINMKKDEQTSMKRQKKNNE